MKVTGLYKSLLILIILVNALLCVHAQDLKKIKWKKEKIAPGLVWKHAHVRTFFDAPQNMNVLIVDTRKRQVTLVYDPLQNRVTSALAKEANAMAAINAGFFDMKNGGSVTYIKVDGAVPDSDTTKWKRSQTRNGAMIIRKNGTFELETGKSSSHYTQNEFYDDVLISGSLLMDDGVKLQLPDDPFVTRRHPRSCLGLIKPYKIVLLTVDGRTDDSAGMTLHELTDLMLSLRCKEALNLDGGGSTTLWLKDKGGVVNMPSDNKKFDHEGERRVSNVIVVK